MLVGCIKRGLSAIVAGPAIEARKILKRGERTMEFKDACKVITIEVAEEMAELGIYTEVDNGSSVRFVSAENGKA